MGSCILRVSQMTSTTWLKSALMSLNSKLNVRCTATSARCHMIYEYDYGGSRCRRWMHHTIPTYRHYFSTLQQNDMDDSTSEDDSNRIPWFPTHRSEIDQIIHRTIQATTLYDHKDDDYKNEEEANNHRSDDMVMSLSSDHPGFHDPAYRQRRTVLAQYAQQYRWDQNENIPIIDYTSNETKVWTMVYDQMIPLVQQYACREYQQALKQMQCDGLYTRTNIPQQSQIYPYLYSQTQFRLRPVAGLLQSRDFLNALALRVFCSTQYIRHESQPYYTPEPDICHELLGHVPLLSNKVFADLSQQIGLASLGASDSAIQQLAKCYWHSVEFGLCDDHEDGTTTKKAYGAGLLSSVGELEYACGGGSTTEKDKQDPTYLPWDPYHAAQQEFPITTYQPIYYVADSILDALEKLKTYCDTQLEPEKPYTVSYNTITERIDIIRK